jgi:hypothetical protein
MWMMGWMSWVEGDEEKHGSKSMRDRVTCFLAQYLRLEPSFTTQNLS